MNIFFLIASVFSFILLGAHFFRAGNISFAAAMISCIALLFIKRRWSRFICTIILSAGIPVWIMTTAESIQHRIISDSPWIRLALIMSAVIVFFIFIAVLSQKSLNRIQAHITDISAGTAAVFTMIILIAGRTKASFPVIMLDRFLPGTGTFEIVLLGIYAGLITELFLSGKDTSKLRVRIWAGFSIVFFSQFILGIMGLDEFLMTGTLHVPVPAVIIGGPIFRGHGFFMVILSLATTIAAGPAWCSYFCYFGAWDNVAARTMKKSGLIPERNILFRIISLSAVVIAAVILRIFFIPAGYAASAAIVFGVSGILIMAGISRKRGVMVHCTSYCPVGLAASLIGRCSPFRIHIKKTCTNCMACSKVCRYGALGSSDIRALHPGFTCTLCGDCISICHADSIGYKFPWLTDQSARMLFTVVVISLHAAFLGFARI